MSALPPSRAAIPYPNPVFIAQSTISGSTVPHPAIWVGYGLEQGLIGSFGPEPWRLDAACMSNPQAVSDTMYLPQHHILWGVTMRAQILKWGNSLAVRIPKSVAEAAQLTAGDPLDIDVPEQGCIHLHRTGNIPSLSELVSRITRENRYPEISAGSELGRESVEW